MVDDPSDVVLGQSRATGTIQDGDVDDPSDDVLTAKVTATKTTVVEGNVATFTVTVGAA